ncbi:MAG: hypothetical protein AAGH88_08230 [Planctomycetota bacterium]
MSQSLKSSTSSRSARRKKFLALIVILLPLPLPLIGSIAGLLIVFASIKSRAAFELTFADFQTSNVVTQYVGLLLAPGYDRHRHARCIIYRLSVIFLDHD